ncbi:Receptor like protein 6, putative [Theobroma cacao]|uniref:Receptor like protein 6, putative n=1 Tax=Theobroma cacao TaxID=3641 RepID=A0A061FRG8_THECC|nr:Receptor like protein 6, putative [Theobroma cacao]
MGWFPWLCQLLCLLLFSLDFQANFSSSLSPSPTPPQCSDFESAALLQFKGTFSINNASAYLCNFVGTKSYPKTNSWMEGTDCCRWKGVVCDSASGHVIGIDLSCSWLYGAITSNSSLFLLRHLQRLNLAYNDFRGSNISPEFGGFASLTHLNLSSSGFSGKIPYSSISQLSTLVSIDLTVRNYGLLQVEEHTLRGLVQNLTKVRVLVLNGVNISAVDPGSLMNLSSSLISLSLNNCGLRGRFPQNIFHLPNLRMLSLSGNRDLSGYLPKTNWSGPLVSLSLWSTSFSGELPDSIGNLESLTYLDLAASTFSGSVPRSLGNLSQLIYLDLCANGFTGHISFSLAKLTQLDHLSLCSNQLVGLIPDQVSLFHKISFLDLAYNFLNGTLPTWLYSHSALEFLYLQGNNFTGQIKEFQQKSLVYIYLGNNKLQGPTPNSIVELVNLTKLSLESNNLSGIVELDMFSKLQNLQVLDLSSNNLSVKSNIDVNYTLPNLFMLFLSSCKLRDFPKFVIALTNLNRLDLSNNGIHGMIPKWLGNVGKNSLSYLNLSNNFLTYLEEIPWNQMQILDLHSNLLQGKLPFLPPTTTFFSISNNSLSGGISSQICNVSFLSILDLSRNNLGGTIPQCLVNFSAYLSVLNLKMNKFYGIIPFSFANDCGLKYINFNGNQLEGRLPPSMAGCRYMEVLDLGNNKINDTFPQWLETLPELQVLVLRSNQLHGFIHGCKSAHCFSKLQILDLSNNDFTGPLPSEYIANLKSMRNQRRNDGSLQYLRDIGSYGYTYDYSVVVAIKGFDRELVKISAIFISIDLSNNKFEGEISTDFGKLISIRGLNLSHNSLNGHIPQSIGNLTVLEWLDLSSNKLVGKIPMQMVDLTSLSFLNLSYNQLVGPIPQGNQFNTFENGSFEGNLDLCGFPLNKACSGNENQQSPSNDSDSEYGFGWKVVLLGYGCGFVFGVAVGYLVIVTRKPKWLGTLVDW